MKQYIQCGKLFTAADEAIYERMALAIEGDRVSEILPWESIPEGAAVIDLSDKFVTPGLIDGHVHITNRPEGDNSVYYATHTQAYMTLVALRQAQADLLAGFTTLRDAGGNDFIDIGVRDGINAGLAVGPRIMAPGKALTITGGTADSQFNPTIQGDCRLGIVCDSPDAMRAAARLNIKYGADHIKIMGTGGVVRIGSTPRASSFTMAELRAAIEVAEEHEMTTMFHAHGKRGILNGTLAGVTSIEHCSQMDEECAEAMAERGTYFVPTMIASARMAEAGDKLPVWMVDKAKEALERIAHALELSRQYKVPLAFGTDASTPLSPHGGQAYEFELITRHSGYTPLELLLAATRTNARMMRWEDRVGSLEPGKFADICAYDRNPLEDIRALAEVSFVMKGGMVVKQDGQPIAALA